MQRSYSQQYPQVDFQFWVMYGSWSCCSACGSFFFNDKYFREKVFKDTATSVTCDLLAPHRRQVPTDPLVHEYGSVGVSSRWWCLPGMYSPVVHCGRCTPPPRGHTASASMTDAMRARNDQYAAGETFRATGELYKIPRMVADGAAFQAWSPECIKFPRYHHGAFHLQNTTGQSILELTEEEQRALRIVCLKTSVQAERYGGAHQLNWKKVGLSRAWYQKSAVQAHSMPTPRAAAAFHFLMEHNEWYKVFHKQHLQLLATGASLNISSYDLFIVQTGIECAMFPWLYPTTDFTDTGILQHYQHKYGDDSNRVVSIGYSWTRKVLSSVRAYGEQRDLSFFLYEKLLACKYFHAQVRARQLGITADILTRDSQASAGYWDIVQDALADLVRIMLVRCFDEENYPQLYSHCRNLRGQVWLCAFPNFFLTIAPAEWRFPLPYFLVPYKQCLFACAYILALHMYYLVRCFWKFLSNKWGHRYFVVFEYVMKTEYQGRGTPHWHIAAWISCFGVLDGLRGRTGTAVVSAFVQFLAFVFCCEIDVQIGNGRLNYINGYVSKDHDSVDVGLGEYVQKNATSPWLAAYRLLSKSSPCIPEVAIRMAQLSEFERSYLHVLLYPPQPAAMLDYDGRQGNFSSKMYGFYLQEKRQEVAAGNCIRESFLVWHRTREYDSQNMCVRYRGGRHNQHHNSTLVVACRYWYELVDGYWGQFTLTQLPHQYASDLLPKAFQHLVSMQNFAALHAGTRAWPQRKGIFPLMLVYSRWIAG